MTPPAFLPPPPQPRTGEPAGDELPGAIGRSANLLGGAAILGVSVLLVVLTLSIKPSR